MFNCTHRTGFEEFVFLLASHWHHVQSIQRNSSPFLIHLFFSAKIWSNAECTHKASKYKKNHVFLLKIIQFNLEWFYNKKKTTLDLPKVHEKIQRETISFAPFIPYLFFLSRTIEKNSPEASQILRNCRVRNVQLSRQCTPSSRDALCVISPSHTYTELRAARIIKQPHTSTGSTTRPLCHAYDHIPLVVQSCFALSSVQTRFDTGFAPTFQLFCYRKNTKHKSR